MSNLKFLLLCLFSIYLSWGSLKQSQMERGLDSLIRHSEFKNHIGVSLYSISKNRSLYGYRSGVSFVPASILKLVVTAMALDVLPANLYASNDIELEGELKGDTFVGDVFIVGKGDPHLSDLSFPSAEVAMDSFVSLIQKEGIQHIIGSVYAIDTLFGRLSYPSIWSKRHAKYCYGSKVTSLTFNRNCLLIKIKSLKQDFNIKLKPNIEYIQIENRIKIKDEVQTSISFFWDRENQKLILNGTMPSFSSFEKAFVREDSQMYFIQAFLQATKNQNLSVDLLNGQITFQKPSFKKILSFRTFPMVKVIYQINQQSQNLQAEMLLRMIGFYLTGKASLELSLAVEKDFLNGLGLDLRRIKLYDGSGLSHKNRVTPWFIMSLLIKISKKPYFKKYWNSLAVPGKHGISVERLKDLHKNIRWKTGYLKGVQTASGYYYNTIDTIAFSIMINNSFVQDEKSADFINQLIKLIHKSDTF